VRAYEFPAKLKSDGKLELPDTILKLIPNDQTVRVIILVSETTDIDRLMHHGEVFYLNGESYRLKGKRKYLDGNATENAAETEIETVDSQVKYTSFSVMGRNGRSRTCFSLFCEFN